MNILVTGGASGLGEAITRRLALSAANERGRLNVVMRMEPRRWRIIESTAADGAKLVAGGRATSGVRQPMPWFNKCGG